MKKKLILSLLALIVIIGASILLWPLSFSDIITSGSALDITITDTSIENGSPVNASVSYTVQPGSEELELIQKILDKYSLKRWK